MREIAAHGGERFGRARRPIAVAIGALLASAETVATAQVTAAQDADVRIEVTGSNIKRVEGETGLPLQVMTREELQRGGVQTAQELLMRISANQSFGSFNENMGEGNTIVGYTSASLRGLGAQRTLVLLDGHRIAPYALSGGQSADLSGIPASAIERVEILKDGASAVYGTDAIGGVINFILRKDYQGAEVNANYFGTEHGGGNNWRASATAGAGSLAKDHYNFFLTVDHFEQDSLRATARESTRTAYRPDIGLDRTSTQAYPANIRQPGGFSGAHNPTVPFPGGATPNSCQQPFSFTTVSRPFQCAFDYASVIDTIPQSRKTNVLGRFTSQIDAANQFFVEGIYYKGTVTQRVSPTPVAQFLDTDPPMALPPTSPYYPAAYVVSLPHGDPNKPVAIQARLVELGPRVDQVDVEQWNFIAGLQGTVKEWDYTLTVSYTANREVDSYLSGTVYSSPFGALVASGAYNPFGPNTPDVVEQMRAMQVTGEANDNRARNYGASLKVSRDAYALPAGPLAVAFGLEGRRERLEQSNSDFVVSGDVLGGAGAIPSLPVGERTVWSLYGEVNVPIVRALEANLAARYDHYSDFGGTLNPKVTLRWQPTKTLLLRSSYGTGFRVPTLSDLFQPPTYALDDSHEDPIRCPVTGDSVDCDGVNTRVGGNTALRPEKSQQVNAGIVLEPAPGFSASADYYWVEVRNVVDTLGIDTIFADPNLTAAYVVRKPPDANYPELPGVIDYVVQYATNIGTLRTSGVDANLRWRGPTTAVGQFSADLDATYVLDYEHTGFASPAAPGKVGVRPDNGLGAIARYRHYAPLNWAYGPWGATLANTFQSGYEELNPLTCDADFTVCGTRHVSSYSVWDIQGRYTGFKNATFALGVRNLFDRQPPVSNQVTAFQAGIDPSYGDPRGRIYYATVRYAFQ
jgi:iron complex outermembrane receptor protein